MSTKKCSKCQKIIPIDEFYFRNKSKGTRKGTCKKCCYTPKKDLCKCGLKKDKRSILCQKCSKEKRLADSDYYTATIGDKTYNKHKYAKYAYIRYYARKTGLENGMTSCINCGYDKHVEICHIKPISDFPQDTKLTVVNHVSNLMSLCPNCHYEFDNGLLELVLPPGLEPGSKV